MLWSLKSSDSINAMTYCPYILSYTLILLISLGHYLSAVTG